MDPLHTIQASGRYDHCKSAHIWGKPQYFTVFDFFRHLLVKIRRSDQFYAILRAIAHRVKYFGGFEIQSGSREKSAGVKFSIYFTAYSITGKKMESEKVSFLRWELFAP